MQIEQILIRPRDQQILAQHTNSAGAQATTFLSYSDMNADQSAALSKVVALVQTKLPADPSPEVVEEIADLEERLADLRKSAGLG
jgi:hypothetical protein